MREQTCWEQDVPHQPHMPALTSARPVSVVCARCGHIVDNLAVNGRGRWVTLPCNHEIMRDV